MREVLAPRFLALVLLAVFAVGCASAPLPDSRSSALLGEIEIQSPSLAVSRLSPTICQSGERHLFLGADFLDGQGVTSRIVVEPTGNALLRFFTSVTPLDPGVTFARSDCSVFEVSLERTGWQINDVYDLALVLQFDCQSASGDKASGRLAAPHCH